MLTNAAAKAACPQARGYKLADAGGLHLFVAPGGAKVWRLKYRFAGREKLLTIGRFPALSVAEARAAREDAKASLRDGRDPGSANLLVADDKFEAVTRAWHAVHSPDWSKAHAADVLGGIERHLFPALGPRPIAAIGAAELLALVGPLGGRPLAKRLRQQLSKIFGFAAVHGLVAADPAAQLGAAMKSAGLARPHPALTSIEDCRQLLDQVYSSDAPIAVKFASRLLALTAVRLDAVRGCRWEEFDLEARTWTVPAARMKLRQVKKGDARFDHVVPLSSAAIGVLAAAREQCAESAQSSGPLFPDLAPDAIAALYRELGWRGRHVPHGWRASFSTILNETLGEEWSAAIDRALAHSPKDKVEAAYNRSAQLARRRDLFERWGTMLAD